MELVAMVRGISDVMLRCVWSRTRGHGERGFRGMSRSVWSGTGGHGERGFRGMLRGVWSRTGGHDERDVERCVECKWWPW